MGSSPGGCRWRLTPVPRGAIGSSQSLYPVANLVGAATRVVQDAHAAPVPIAVLTATLAILVTSDRQGSGF
jgi:hypothetical protein